MSHRTDWPRKSFEHMNCSADKKVQFNAIRLCALFFIKTCNFPVTLVWVYLVLHPCFSDVLHLFEKCSGCIAGIHLLRQFKVINGWFLAHWEASSGQNGFQFHVCLTLTNFVDILIFSSDFLCLMRYMFNIKTGMLQKKRIFGLDQLLRTLQLKLTLVFLFLSL